MHVVIFASGELVAESASAIAALQGRDLTIAADGGLRHCNLLGIEVDVLIGDFDSLDTETVDMVRSQGRTEVIEHCQDKHDTDLALAMELASDRGATSITVVAAFGGRLDHELATLGLLCSPRWQSLRVTATDGRRQLWVVRSSIQLQLPVASTVSLVPWTGDVGGVTTTGLQWPLDHEPLLLGSTRGVSNVCIDPGQSVSISSGTLLVVTDSIEADSVNI